MPHNESLDRPANSLGVWVQKNGVCWIGFENSVLYGGNPESRKWVVFCSQGAVYAAHTDGLLDQPPKFQWEVSNWINDNGEGKVAGIAGAAPAPSCQVTCAASTCHCQPHTNCERKATYQYACCPSDTHPDADCAQGLCAGGVVNRDAVICNNSQAGSACGSSKHAEFVLTCGEIHDQIRSGFRQNCAQTVTDYMAAYPQCCGSPAPPAPLCMATCNTFMGCDVLAGECGDQFGTTCKTGEGEACYSQCDGMDANTTPAELDTCATCVIANAGTNASGCYDCFKCYVTEVEAGPKLTWGSVARPNSLAVPSWVPDCDCHRAIWREFWDPAHACPTWVRMTVTLAVPESVGFDAQGLVEAVAKAAGVQEPTRVKVGSTQVSPTLSGHTDVDISVRVPHSEDLMNASAAIRDALNAAEAEQAIGVAVGASVDVSNGPFIDEARTRSSWAELQCSPGLQCGDAGCPKCVCDCTIPCSAA